MKKVSSWAAVIAVPTLVTGYYGMNVPFPGSGERMGVVVATGLIGLLSLSLYLQACPRPATTRRRVPRQRSGLRSRPGSICSAQRSGGGQHHHPEVVAGTTVTPWARLARGLAGADPGAGSEALDPAAPGRPRPRPPRRPQPRGHARPAGPGGAGPEVEASVGGRGAGALSSGRAKGGASRSTDVSGRERGIRLPPRQGRPSVRPVGWGRSRPPRRRPRSGAGLGGHGQQELIARSLSACTVADTVVTPAWRPRRRGPGQRALDATPEPAPRPGTAPRTVPSAPGQRGGAHAPRHRRTRPRRSGGVAVGAAIARQLPPGRPLAPRRGTGGRWWWGCSVDQAPRGPRHRGRGRPHGEGEGDPSHGSTLTRPVVIVNRPVIILPCWRRGIRHT